MDRLRQNVRYALRSLRRSPGFAAVAILTLALGIGATTAIFAVVYNVVIDPLPYPSSGRLVHIEHPVPRENPDWRWGVSEAGYFHFAEHNRTLDGIGVYSTRQLILTGGGTAAHADAAIASASLLSVLGARPAVGRLLVTADNRAADAPLSAAVLGHELWRTRFAADPSIVGRTIEVEGVPVQVVGVVEAGFQLPDQPVDLWLPAGIDPANTPVNWHRFQAVGRVSAGVPIERAEADLARLKDQFTEAIPQAYSPAFMERTGFTVQVDPLRDQVVGDVDRALWILLGAVGIVLLIACANVANLFLVRLEARRREVSIRTALGASSRDLAWRYVTESVVLALIAGAASLFLAWGGIRLLLAMAPADIPRLGEVGIGPEAIAFAGVVSLATGLVFGLLPLARRAGDFSGLREASRSMTSSRRQRGLRSALVVGEIALALVLLTSAGLMLRTFQNLRSIDPGVEAEGVVTAQLSLPGGSYQSDQAVAAFHRDLSSRLAALPGVTAVGATQALPLANVGGGGASCAVVFTDDPEAEARNSGCFASPVRATPGYFEAMGIPVRGRVPGWSEVGGGRGGAIISRALAEHLWPGQDPIGKGIRGNGDEPPYYRIVGVAGDVRASGLTEPPIERVYFPMVAMEGAWLWDRPLAMTMVVKSATDDVQGLAAAIRRVVADMDASVPVANVRTMEQVMAGSISRTSFAMLLIGIAAAVALLLGVIGLYGVIGYVVEQRRAEIGVRRALGAGARQVTGMVLGQSLRLVLIGIAIGLLAALAATRALQAFLYEVSPTDPLTLAAVSLLLAIVAAAASLIPARRAARVDPMTALRAE